MKKALTARLKRFAIPTMAVFAILVLILIWAYGFVSSNIAKRDIANAILDEKGIVFLRDFLTGAETTVHEKSKLNSLWCSSIVGTSYSWQSTPTSSTLARQEKTCRLETLGIDVGDSEKLDSDVCAILPKFKHLRSLSFSAKIPQGNIHEIANLTKLNFLGLSSPNTSPELIAELAKLPSLSHLQLSNMHLTPEIMGGLAKLPQLESLDLMRCHGLDTSELSQLSTNTSLRNLSVMGCDGTAGLWKDLNRFSNLHELMISAPPALDQLQGEALSNLKVLTLIFVSSIDDSTIQRIKAIPKLGHLRIQVSTLSPGTIATLEELKSKGVRIELERNTTE